MSDRIDRLIADAVACDSCGVEHHNQPRICTCTPDCKHKLGASWASPVDGHPLRRKAIDGYWLRAWAEANPA